MWFFLALATALSEAARAVYAKIVLKESDEYLVAWTQRLLSLPIFLFLGWKYFPSAISGKFLLTVVAASVLLIAATTLYMKALKVSPMYLTMPYLSLTPLFMLITSRIMVDEVPSLTGFAGILLLAAGLYLLNTDNTKSIRGLFEPLKALGKERGSRLMMIVAFLFSIGSNLDKIGVSESNFVFYSASVSAVFSVAYLPLALRNSSSLRSAKWRKLMGRLILLSALYSAVILFHTSAMASGMALYVIPVKRLSILLSVVLGAVLFREKNLRRHALAALLMIAGAALISVA